MKVSHTNKIHFFLSLLGISLLIFSQIYGCKTEEHEKIQKTSSSLADPSEPQFSKEGELTFSGVDNKKIITIDIEIADTRGEMTRGLMYRRTMAETQGMIFVHGMYKYPFFWMKNTYIPYDIFR